MALDVARRSRHATVLVRVLTAVLGGYAFCWGFMALSISGLSTLGMPFEDAEHLSNILGVLLYLMVFLWAFAERNLRCVWLLLIGGGMLMTVGASFIQHQLT